MRGIRPGVTCQAGIATAAAVAVLLGMTAGGADAQLYTLSRTLQGPAPAASDNTGFAVAVVGDNVLVGVPFDSSLVSNAGAAYLFDGSTGAVLRTFRSPTPTTGDSFGYSVAAAGTNVLIGAPFDDTAGVDAGAAYLFNSSTGALMATFLNPTPAGFDQFGNSVTAMGTTVVVGAPGDDTGAINAGAAYVFSSGGALQRTLVKSTPAVGDNFGHVVVALGANVAVGAPFDDTGAADAGAAYLLSPSSGATVATFANPNPASGDEFGYALAPMGANLLVGAPFDNVGASDAGAVYLMDGATGALVDTFSNPILFAGDAFGFAVAAVGNNVLVGAPYADTGAVDAGAAYLINGTTGALLQSLVNPTPVSLDQFGNAVAALGGNPVVGAPGDDTGGADAGAAYVFDPCGQTPVAPGTCKQPAVAAKALLLMKDTANDLRDLVRWRWIKGAVTNKTEFGDPTTASSYGFCVYNDPGALGSPQLVFRATAPAGGLCRGKPCWRATTTGFKYTNRDRTPDGVQTVRLKEGAAAGTAKIIFTAKGDLLDLPAMPLSGPTKVTVQIKNSDGLCWEAVYSDPPLRNTTELFKDRAD